MAAQRKHSLQTTLQGMLSSVVVALTLHLSFGLTPIISSSIPRMQGDKLRRRRGKEITTVGKDNKAIKVEQSRQVDDVTRGINQRVRSVLLVLGSL